MKRIIQGICVLSSVLIISSCSREKPGSSFNSAIELKYISAGSINSILTDVSGEYYRFSLRKTVNMEFSYSGPSEYHYSLSSYLEPEIVIKESVSAGLSIELKPSTYYIHIYVDDISKIRNEEYTINYRAPGIGDDSGYHIPRGTRDTYDFALWENESLPKGYDRYSKEEQYIDKSELDPMYYEKGKLNNEIYLDSALYILDTELMLSLSEEIKPLYEYVNNLDRNSDLSKKLASLIEDYKKESKADEFVKDLIIDMYEEMLLLTKRSVDAVMDYNSRLNSLVELSSRQISQEELSNCVIRIPYFYRVSIGDKISIKRVYYEPYDCSYCYYYYDIACVLKNREFDNHIRLYQGLMLYVDRTVKGELTLLKDYKEYKEYREDKEVNNKTVHLYNCDFDKDSYSYYDDKYHSGHCNECNVNLYLEHTFEEFVLGEYHCLYCGYIKHSTPTTSKILVNSMPFPQIYNLDPIEQDITDSNGNTIRTKRLRTGMIEGYLTMSSISNDADKAYIEYYFDKPVFNIQYNIGLWGSKENFPANTKLKVEYFDLTNGIWVTKLNREVNLITTDKNNLDSCSLQLRYSTNAIRFIIESQKNPNSEEDLGKIVLGDIDVTYIN